MKYDIQPLISATASAWQRTREYESRYGCEHYRTQRELNVACKLNEVLDAITGEHWVYLGVDDDER